MFNNISFVGGVHGVGKSTMCQEIFDQLKIQYLSASEVLNWAKLNSDPTNKLVKDIPHTQDLLIEGLKKIIVPNKKYLLDGHFCLFSSSYEIIRVPTKTFEAINPNFLGIIVDDAHLIKQRLEERDGKIWGLFLIEKIQKEEINYAKELSAKLNVKIAIGKDNVFSLLHRN